MPRFGNISPMKYVGKFPKAHEYVEFPITDLVYFAGAKRQTTIV